MLKAMVKRRIPLGVQRAGRQLLDELQIMHIHRRSRRQCKSYDGRNELKLNFGSGRNHKSGWVNIDLKLGADLRLDLREDIPLRDGVAQIIYSEHFFEHLDYPRDAKHFLGECFRILRSGGLFSVGVPDTAWPLREYGANGDRYLKSVERFGWHPPWCKTFLEHINYHFRQDNEHRFAYDFVTLQGALVDSGFSKVEQRDFDPSLDSEDRKVGTLYVNGIKP
jgi:predicted SAM-dependent methyltransferase